MLCLLEFRFECLADGETHRLGGLDFDLGTGLRIAAFAGFAGGDFERSEADQLDRVAFLEGACDGVDNGFDGVFCRGFRCVFTECFLNAGYEFCFVHGVFVVWVGW